MDFEQEIAQTEYLIMVFRNRPLLIEEYDEERFLLIIDQMIVRPGRHLIFRLKNDLELEENTQEVG